MPPIQLRPTFEILISEERQEAIDKLQAEFARSSDHRDFILHGEYGELHLPACEHRLWSPHLSFYVSQRDGQSLIQGRFAPRLEVWTFVWVIYLAMSFTAFFGLALAYSQWMLGEEGWGLPIAGCAVSVIGVLYVVASIGQQWSADQMQALRDRLDDLLQRAGVRQEFASAIVPQEHLA